MTLANERCIPCRGSELPLPVEETDELRCQLDPAWKVVDGHHLSREFEFPDFASALAFTNRVGTIAEEQGHHPDIRLGWGMVELSIWTHTTDGLTRSDFILAAKIDTL